MCLFPFVYLTPRTHIIVYPFYVDEMLSGRVLKFDPNDIIHVVFFISYAFHMGKSVCSKINANEIAIKTFV